jgi:hypothetical protein
MLLIASSTTNQQQAKQLDSKTARYAKPIGCCIVHGNPTTTPNKKTSLEGTQEEK